MKTYLLAAAIFFAGAGVALVSLYLFRKEPDPRLSRIARFGIACGCVAICCGILVLFTGT